jgi:LacI family transcriptional regulator
MPVRMKDIARDLNVSVVTVSKVLRNHTDIGAETRERVLKRIKELNYQPNLAARSLVTGRTYTIGLVVPDLVHPFFAQVAKGIVRRIRPKGYSLIIASAEEDTDLERQEIEHLLARQVDALIVASTRSTPDVFERMEGQRTPLVLIDRRFPSLKINYVGVDDNEIGYVATRHLIDIGRKRIAHIRGRDLSNGLGRLDGYHRALGESRRVAPPGYVVEGRSTDASGDVSGYHAMRQLLTANPQPDAVFCFNDPTAMGAMKAILEAGLRIPEDIAVIGAGNLRYSDQLRVPLSTIDQSSDEMGERAAKLALKAIESKSPLAPRKVILEPKLVVRESTVRPV